MEQFGVDDFDMANYPERDNEGNIQFSCWRLDCEGKNGQLFWCPRPTKDDRNAGEMIPHGLTISSAHRAAQRWTEPKFDDISTPEREAFQKGWSRSRSKIGLWFYQRDAKDVADQHWEETKTQFTPSPQHWLTMGELIDGKWTGRYAKWREDAFEGREAMDPRKHLPSPGGIKADEIKNHVKDMKAREADREAQIKRAVDQGKELEELRKTVEAW